MKHCVVKQHKRGIINSDLNKQNETEGDDLTYLYIIIHQIVSYIYIFYIYIYILYIFLYLYIYV